MSQGYHQNLDEIINEAIFDESAKDMIIVKDIEFYSLCEHHLIPFYGKAHVGYIPDGKIIGLSKIPRVIDFYARRLQVQERLTNQIATCIQDLLNPKGVAVVMEGRHFCMLMRGVQKQNSIASTSSMLGAFKDKSTTRNEFLKLVEVNKI
ncbi:MAG: GTP cyclohydrolase 1 [Candidatus Neomarinimicrobiota bacterium]|nr:MAG: GTP cyclohydrolase 1 [Candidatus Neomarinimicrobiota bacterium]